MHDINFIRENPTQFDEGLKKTVDWYTTKYGT